MIVVVGSINIDLISHTPRLPQPGETILGTAFHMAAGGKGANQAVAAARMGAPVAMVGCVGEDAFAKFVLAELNTAGIDMQVRIDPESATATGAIFVDRDGRNSIVVAPGANARLTAADVEAASGLFDAAAMIALQLEIPLATNDAALAAARRRGLPVILNAAPMDAGASELIAACDWLVVNEVEAEHLSGRQASNVADAIAIAEAIERPAQRIVVTLGAAGAVLVHQHRSCHVPAPRVDVIDTTAAGDAFVGALAAGLHGGASDEEALRQAVYAGSLACTRMGAVPSLPTAAEVAGMVNGDRSSVIGTNE